MLPTDLGMSTMSQTGLEEHSMMWEDDHNGFLNGKTGITKQWSWPRGTVELALWHSGTASWHKVAGLVAQCSWPHGTVELAS